MEERRIGMVNSKGVISFSNNSTTKRGANWKAKRSPVTINIGAIKTSETRNDEFQPNLARGTARFEKRS